MTEDTNDLPLCGGGGTEDDDNSKVGKKNKEQDKPLPLHGGGVTEDNEDLPLCGGEEQRMMKIERSATTTRNRMNLSIYMEAA